MQRKEHKIAHIVPDSIADQLEIQPGDVLLSVNGIEIEDIFDYHYQLNEEYLTIVTRRPDGEEWEYEIEKEYEEDLGIEFENGLMDSYRSCSNQCIFCFIDQMPPGMRDTLYFKDDDARLSFLQGNYVTLTNMKDRDIERIIMYKLAPINISVQTMNPKLRCTMLHNRFAGEALKKMKRLYEAGIEMNGQIVLCKGVNDKEELEYSIRELTAYIPHMKSVSIVPVGLTKYRDGLYPLEPFTKEDAAELLKTVREWQDCCMERWGIHFIHASDEWYFLAGEELPPSETYDGFVQLENGVGMTRLLMDEFQDALDKESSSTVSEEELCRMQRAADAEESDGERRAAGTEESEEMRNAKAAEKSDEMRSVIEDIEEQKERFSSRISVATGALAAPVIEELAQRFMQRHPARQIEVFAVRNDFFGEMITVSGLLTGQDLLGQLQGRELGERLLLPCSLLRSGEEVFLDDMTVTELKNALQVNIVIVNSNGQDLYDAFLE